MASSEQPSLVFLLVIIVVAFALMGIATWILYPDMLDDPIELQEDSTGPVSSPGDTTVAVATDGPKAEGYNPDAPTATRNTDQLFEDHPPSEKGPVTTGFQTQQVFAGEQKRPSKPFVGDEPVMRVPRGEVRGLPKERGPHDDIDRGPRSGHDSAHNAGPDSSGDRGPPNDVDPTPPVNRP